MRARPHTRPARYSLFIVRARLIFGAVGWCALLMASALPASAAHGEPQCSVALELTSVTTRAGCWIDAPRKGARGTAQYTCRGGSTRVTFGPHTFRGKITKGTLHAEATSEFEFEDGCVWRTSQSVQGALADKKLRYAYTERVVKSDGSCASPCSAKGDIRVLD